MAKPSWKKVSEFKAHLVHECAELGVRAHRNRSSRSARDRNSYGNNRYTVTTTFAWVELSRAALTQLGIEVPAFERDEWFRITAGGTCSNIREAQLLAESIMRGETPIHAKVIDAPVAIGGQLFGLYMGSK